MHMGGEYCRMEGNMIQCGKIREGQMMKKMILGVGLFVSGVVLCCTDYAVRRVLASLPNTTLVPGGIPVSWAAYLVMALGAALAAYGYWKD